MEQRSEIKTVVIDGVEMIRANFWSTTGGASTSTFHITDHAGAQWWINTMKSRDGRSRS